MEANIAVGIMMAKVVERMDWILDPPIRTINLRMLEASIGVVIPKVEKMELILKLLILARETMN